MPNVQTIFFYLEKGDDCERSRTSVYFPMTLPPADAAASLVTKEVCIF